MDKITKIKELTNELLQYCHEYYGLDQPTISDKEYDKKFDELKKLEDETGFYLANSPTKNVQGCVCNGFIKVSHSKPMLSAAKTKNIEEIKAFVGDKMFYCSYKLDGLTMIAIYNHGSFQQAITRGNGYIGEDVTAQAKMISNLPLHIQYDGYLELRGECVISYDKFQMINSQLSKPFSHPRNLAAGTLRQLNPNLVKQRSLSYIVFECVSFDQSNSKLDALTFLDMLGFETVGRVTASNVEMCIELMPAAACAYPVDGLVFELDDIKLSAELGHTNHHEKCRMAYKWLDCTQETTLRNVEWNPSRNGILSPVAVFDEVDLDGAKTTRATLHNLSIVQQLELGIGDTILVYRSNMVIPKIDDNITRSNTLRIPEKCPCCGHQTHIVFTDTSKFLKCANPFCPAKTLAQFTHLVSRAGLNIDGLSEKTLHVLLDNGFIKTYKDLFYLNQYSTKLIDIDGFGETLVYSLLDSIEHARHVKLANYLYALGITGLGNSAAKTISKHFGGSYEAFKNSLNDNFDFSILNGVGQSLSKSIKEYFNTNKLYQGLAEELIFVHESATENQKFHGMKFCITGSFPEKRDVLKQKLEDAGAVFVSGVSKNIDVLFAGEKAGSKLEKANKLGLKIMGYDDLITILQ